MGKRKAPAKPGKKTAPQWDGQKVRALRGHMQMTQRQMAAELGTRQQTISEWEKEMYKPRGTSATLLTFVAERAKFKYRADKE